MSTIIHKGCPKRWHWLLENPSERSQTLKAITGLQGQGISHCHCLSIFAVAVPALHRGGTQSLLCKVLNNENTTTEVRNPLGRIPRAAHWHCTQSRQWLGQWRCCCCRSHSTRSVREMIRAIFSSSCLLLYSLEIQAGILINLQLRSR